MEFSIVFLLLSFAGVVGVIGFLVWHVYATYLTG